MSQENVEIVRDSLEALADGGLDALAEFWNPDINWRAKEGAPDDVGEMHGRESARRYVQDWFDTFDNFTVASEELLDVGDDGVVAVQHLTGRARLAASRRSFAMRSCTPFARGRSRACGSTATARRLSTPSGCGSKRGEFR